MLNARYITMDNCLSGYYNDKEKGWTKLSDEDREKYFQKMVDWLVAQTKRGSQLRENLKETKMAYIQNCGILGRLWVNLEHEERVEYCAGQDYPSELRLVKKIVAGRRVR